MKPAILISVKTFYARAIVNGEKTIELRRKLHLASFPPGAQLYIYSTVPDGRIIGAAEVERADMFAVAELRAQMATLDSVARKVGMWLYDYDAYFNGCEYGFGIRLCRPRRFARAVLLKDVPDLFVNGRAQPPQTYRHLSESAARYLAALPAAPAELQSHAT